MRVKLTFQPNESMPPDLYAQLKKAIAVVVGGYGLSAHLEEDRHAEMESYQRYWSWQRQMRENEDKWPSVSAAIDE